MPRRLQPEQHDVPVRRGHRASRGRVAVRFRNSAVRVARVGPVVRAVHEHHAAVARAPVGRPVGRVLRGAGRGRAAGRARPRPRRTGRRNGRVRNVRFRTRVVFLTVSNGLAGHHVRIRR